MTKTQQEELYEMAWTVPQPRQVLKNQLRQAYGEILMSEGK